MELTDLRARFDRISPFYGGGARLVFGSGLERATLALLPNLPPSESALVVGAVWPSFLIELALSGRTGRIMCVDHSRALLDRAERLYIARGLDPDSIDFVHAAIETLPPNLQFDLICTNFFLGRYSTRALADVVCRLEGNLASGGLWYVSDFAGGEALRVRWLYRLLRFAGRTSARRPPDFQRCFETVGFGPVLARMDRAGIVRTQILKRRRVAPHPLPARAARRAAVP